MEQATRPDDDCCGDTPSDTSAGAFRVVLVNPYELGRQPFALAEPTAWLRRAGFDSVSCRCSAGRASPTC